jgi:hypothetical protein
VQLLPRIEQRKYIAIWMSRIFRLFVGRRGGGGTSSSTDDVISDSDTAPLVDPATTVVALEEEDAEESTPLTMAASSDDFMNSLVVEIPLTPPSYDEGAGAGLTHVELVGADCGEVGGGGLDPPSYQAATKLPTYEEAERTKGKQITHTSSFTLFSGNKFILISRVGGFVSVHIIETTCISGGKDDSSSSSSAPLPASDSITVGLGSDRLTLLPIRTASAAAAEDDDLDYPPPNMADTALLGNDFIFFIAFSTAFLFNWIGFLMLMCFCHTIAARYDFERMIV